MFMVKGYLMINSGSLLEREPFGPVLIPIHYYINVTY